MWCVSRVACRLRACRSTVRLGLPDFLGQMTKCIDDTLMWSDDLKESFFQAVKWLDICGNNGIILNPEKFQFGKSTVEFAGFEITPTTVRPCARYLEAIQHFITPWGRYRYLVAPQGYISSGDGYSRRFDEIEAK